jgi:hypothetical protein
MNYGRGDNDNSFAKVGVAFLVLIAILIIYAIYSLQG